MADTIGSASRSTPLVDAFPSGYVGTCPKGARDGAWKYAFEGAKPGSVICIKCERVLYGGINRLKYHLVSISKHNARICPWAIEEIKREMNVILATGEEQKLQKERAKLAMRASIAKSQGASINLEEEGEAL